MAGEITRDTLIKDLDGPLRMVNALCSGFPLLFFGKRSATVGDYVDLPEEMMFRVQGIGRKSLRDWKRLTAHLRKDYNADLIISRDVSKDISDELRALRKLRATLNHIGGAHKNLARLYGEMAEIVLPLDRM